MFEQQTAEFPPPTVVVVVSQDMASDPCVKARESCGQPFAVKLPEKIPVVEENETFAHDA